MNSPLMYFKKLASAKKINLTQFFEEWKQKTVENNEQMKKDFLDDPSTLLRPIFRLARMQVVEWKGRDKKRVSKKAIIPRPFVPKKILSIDKIKIYDTSGYEGSLVIIAKVVCTDCIEREVKFTSRYKVLDHLSPPTEDFSLKWKKLDKPLKV